MISITTLFLVKLSPIATRKSVVIEINQLIPNFNFINAIHPSVIIGKNVKIGVGSVFMAGVIINNDSNIGDHCFIATKSSIDHDSTLGNYSSLSPGVTTGGRVVIGETTAIGIGASILHYISIGKECVIGGGALVNKNIEDNYLAYGVPIQKVKERSSEEKYL
ncbi:transferase [Gramella sp. KN1008]|uniref:transferase n=1 Tax=Gramella sp. KN1008 TaxID=2529298 RepID=UPI00103D8346|nr:transferase [Gramella sp. KN1008]TBW26441.1 transferase [Gramella sp. KN1008]